MTSFALEGDGAGAPLLVWRPATPVLAAATTVLGGGLGPRRWLLNLTVPAGYARRDPATHLADVAAGAGLRGPGVGMMTAVDVRCVQVHTDGGVEASATVGLGIPTWPAAVSPADGWPEVHRDGAGEHAPGGAPLPGLAGGVGTVNLVVWVPVALEDGALLNALTTATEARAQALVELGVPGTGTASDAVAVACPLPGGAATEPFAGPRSRWGRRLARAVHGAVRAGALLDPHVQAHHAPGAAPSVGPADADARRPPR